MAAGQVRISFIAMQGARVGDRQGAARNLLRACDCAGRLVPEAYVHFAAARPGVPVVVPRISNGLSPCRR